MTKRNIRNGLFLFSALFAVTACMSMPYPKGKPMPVQTFAHIKILNVPVATLSIQKEEMSNGLPNSFENMLDDYFRRKIAPTTNTNTMEIRYKTLSLKSEPLDDNPFNFAGFMGQGNQILHTLNLQISVSILDENNKMLASEDIVINHRYAISQHASIQKREQIEFLEMEKVFTTLDPVAEKIIRSQIEFMQ